MIVFLGSFFGVIFVIMLAILAKTTGRKFDFLLKEKNISLPTNLAFTLPDSWGRAIGYSILILFFKSGNQHSWRHRRFQQQYKGFNFYASASKIDIILSTLSLISLLLTIVSILYVVILGVLK